MKTILVTGGCGFIGSHLCEKLLELGNYVICVDNLFSGDIENIRYIRNHPNFEFIRHDVTNELFLEIDQIYHLACPASPKDYQYNSIKTIKTNVIGTMNMLGLAKRTRARILLTSTSEIYGDPEISPQHEDYFGNVNPIGIRSCYDEGKRVAETLMMEYNRNCGVDTRIARIFNTYGPRLREGDGRVVSNFIVQTLNNKDITIYGDGSQTRSFCYIDDQIDGLIKLMESNYIFPINIGNPEEITINELARRVIDISGNNSEIKYYELPQDDPKRRKPDITRANEILNWYPNINLENGLRRTFDHFRKNNY